MGVRQEVEAGIEGVLAPDWEVRQGIKVPEAEDIVLRNGAVRLTATYLYADMADSTGLAQNYRDWAVAKVIRCYLNAAARLIRHRGGAIRSYDGDRVMGIFAGPASLDQAVVAAMNIHWAVRNVIQPQLEKKWNDFGWTMNHGIGIDTGEALLVRGGVFGNNDLVSIGSAPNVAAKLSGERRSDTYLFVSRSVYDSLTDATRYANGVNMWRNLGATTYGGRTTQYYGSNYSWEP